MGNVNIAHIAKTPGVCGGKACIAGHRIRVMDIVVWHEMRGYSPDEIHAHYTYLSLAQIHAALAYYYDNRQTIDAEVEESIEYAERMRAEHPNRFTRRELMERLKRKQASSTENS